ncbi:hypothetical protein N7490_006276 [Penicillium lividum]|nr:hypothetical protein N7490_006276 [Penicillium lividum]
MVHYVHVIGRKHGVTSSKIDDQIGRLEETIGFALPEGSKWHGIYYHQGRKRVHPSWFRKELIFAFAGHKGLKRLDEIWYQTWIFVVNLKIEGGFQESLIRKLLGLDMTVERVECTDGGRLDELTKCMLQLKNEIPWLDNGQARKEDPKGCFYFGKRILAPGEFDFKLFLDILEESQGGLLRHFSTAAE